jgi:phosphoglycolate phosphatase
VERLFSNWSWAAVVGQREGVPRKPDPASALAVARDLACPPDRCWFVGDSDVDMQTGRNAGMRVVGVNWGFRPEEELRQAGAHHLIAHPEALLGLLDEAANEEGA